MSAGVIIGGQRGVKRLERGILQVHSLLYIGLEWKAGARGAW
jgi:hypothetical protein